MPVSPEECAAAGMFYLPEELGGPLCAESCPPGTEFSAVAGGGWCVPTAGPAGPIQCPGGTTPTVDPDTGEEYCVLSGEPSSVPCFGRSHEHVAWVDDEGLSHCKCDAGYVRDIDTLECVKSYVPGPSPAPGGAPSSGLHPVIDQQAAQQAGLSLPALVRSVDFWKYFALPAVAAYAVTAFVFPR